MNLEEMIQLIDHVSASELTSFTYETEDERISMKCGQAPTVVTNGIPVNVTAMQSGEAVPVAAAVPTVQTAAPAVLSSAVQNTETKAVQGNIIKSPLVGTFYTAPAEDAPAFVKVGDTVTKGQIVAIVEAMKLMNEIESDFDGKVAEIYVQNGEAVEYGQPLLRIE